MFKLFPILTFLIFSCDNDPPEKHGCLDSQACNYDSEANVDLFPDTTCIYYVDCAGECGGNALDSDNDGVCDE